MVFPSVCCSLCLILLLQIFSHAKSTSKRRLHINMILWTFYLVRKVSIHWDKPHLWNGISEEASDGSLFWLWQSILELTYGVLKGMILVCCWLCTLFPCQAKCGGNPLQLRIPITDLCSAGIADELHWELCWVEADTWPSQSMTYETYCTSKAPYLFCRMDWKLTFVSQTL